MDLMIQSDALELLVWLPCTIKLCAPAVILGMEAPDVACIALLSDGRRHHSLRFIHEKTLECELHGDWLRYGFLYFYRETFSIKVTIKDFMTEDIHEKLKETNSPRIEQLSLPKADENI
jgi:hypothetical protein